LYLIRNLFFFAFRLSVSSLRVVSSFDGVVRFASYRDDAFFASYRALRVRMTIL